MRRSEILIKANRKSIPLDKYTGEWVAFANGKVVAHQDTLKKLMKDVKRFKRKPSVFLVPEKSEGPYV